MDINATLIGEVITFIFFVWFTMKFVWPPLVKVMDERRKQIADGLAAAKHGQDELELAAHKSNDILAAAKVQASAIVEQANQRANHIVEESKNAARVEGERLLKLAKNDIAQEVVTARQELLTQVADMAVAGAEKLLKREISLHGDDLLIQEALGEING